MRNAFPRVFGMTYHIANLFGFRVKEEIGLSLKLLSKGQLFMSAIYALTVGFLLLYLGTYLLEDGSVLTELIIINNYWNGLLIWLLISSGIYLTILIKQAFLLLMSRMFNLSNGYKRQFTDFFTTSSVFFLMASIVLSVLLYAQVISGNSLSLLLAEIVIVFFLYRTVLIYIKLAQTSSYSKLYIFSYICSTELIPLFIGIHYLMK
ncbi:MAG: DUF4271 domain-containing protein [Flavobacteriales bacterium]|nr:DUF4271 domain-containing protein [Flavobacteriales bacterium]